MFINVAGWKRISFQVHRRAGNSGLCCRRSNEAFSKEKQIFIGRTARRGRPGHKEEVKWSKSIDLRPSAGPDQPERRFMSHLSEGIHSGTFLFEQERPTVNYRRLVRLFRGKRRQIRFCSGEYDKLMVCARGRREL